MSAKFRIFRTQLLPTLLLACGGFALAASATQPDYLGDLSVTATRVSKPLYQIPAAVGQVSLDDIQLDRQQIGLDESLVKIPGVFMQNRYNFAQDLRISIRGFGSRATFGIRGIKLYVDGIPETLPDGQAGVDSIDIGSLERIEVIRGPVSSLYGSASGGAINMYTEDGPQDAPIFDLRSSFGSYGFRKHQAKLGGQQGQLNYLINLSSFSLDGYRDHSKTESRLLNSKLRFDIDARSDLTLALNAVDSPIAQDPGGLRRRGNAFNTDITTPTVAQKNNLRFDSMEAVEQQRIGLVYNRTLGEHHAFTVRNYYVFRKFFSKRPTGVSSDDVITPKGGIIDLDRFVVGGGAQYSYSGNLLGRKNRLTVGLELDKQMDERKNYTNIENSTRIGPKSLDQDENVVNWGIYLQNEFSLSDDLELTLGARYDKVDFKFRDKHFTEGVVDGTPLDDSGNISFTQFSPSVGLLWRLDNSTNLYGNISTSFETPSSREYANPTGGAGFNAALKEQNAINYEVGIKGALSTKTSYDLAVFRIETDDELIKAGEIGTQDNETAYYANAGKTIRNGLEAAVTAHPLSGLNITLAYTYSDFKFDQFIDDQGASHAGNRIPGIPKQSAHAEVSYFHPSGFHTAWDTQLVDQVYVDNANSDAAEGYGVSNLRLGYSLNYGKVEITPFLAVNNIFDKKYIGAVRVEENWNRFFEPAPERNSYAGVSLKLPL